MLYLLTIIDFIKEFKSYYQNLDFIVTPEFEKRAETLINLILEYHINNSQPMWMWNMVGNTITPNYIELWKLNMVPILNRAYNTDVESYINMMNIPPHDYLDKDLIDIDSWKYSLVIKEMMIWKLNHYIASAREVLFDYVWKLSYDQIKSIRDEFLMSYNNQEDSIKAIDNLSDRIIMFLTAWMHKNRFYDIDNIELEMKELIKSFNMLSNNNSDERWLYEFVQESIESRDFLPYAGLDIAMASYYLIKLNISPVNKKFIADEIFTRTYNSLQKYV